MQHVLKTNSGSNLMGKTGNVNVVIVTEPLAVLFGSKEHRFIERLSVMLHLPGTEFSGV